MRTSCPSLRELARSIATGELTSTDLVRRCLDRISAAEPEVRAWVRVEREPALADAAGLDGSPRRGPLHGLPAGIKDTMDVAGVPTGCGSEVRAGRPAERDAPVVARLRDAGAILLGKTVTTEFAYFQPGPTRNPHDPARTPGGSSSGSAAAVASGMVPFALGTQTAGSVARPASFCGIAGYVAPPGALPMTGISPLSTTLDSVGVLARTVPDLEFVRAALHGHHDLAEPVALDRPRLLVADGSALIEMDPGFPEALDRVTSRVAADRLPDDVDLPGLLEPHATVLAFEAARLLRFDPAERSQLSSVLRDLLDLGADTARTDYERALATIRTQRGRMLALLTEYDAVLAPAAPGAAPPRLPTTGNPAMSRPWQAMGLPAVAVPGLRDDASMPLGVQLIGHPEGEDRLFAAARMLERTLRD
jgi:Asp-tRNA(Asn)/Glu-tRNA(Gln) amidotransferase A subunit family amidase